MSESGFQPYAKTLYKAVEELIIEHQKLKDESAAKSISPEQLGKLAWEMALSEGRKESDHLIAATRLTYNADRYVDLAKAALDYLGITVRES